VTAVSAYLIIKGGRFRGHTFLCWPDTGVMFVV